jgi:hypothetical protein
VRHRLLASLLAAIGLVAALAAPAAAGPATEPITYDDVDESQFFHDAVHWVDQQDITRGTTASTYSPARAITRAEFVTLLWRFAGSPAPDGESAFSDAAGFHAQALAWARAAGITGGRDGARFDGGAFITRAETVTMMWRYTCSPDEPGVHGFDDVPAGSFFAAAVRWAKAAGITSGRTLEQFGSFLSLDRGEAATLLWRLAGSPEPWDPGQNRTTDAPDCGGGVDDPEPPVAEGRDECLEDPWSCEEPCWGALTAQPLPRQCVPVPFPT